MKTLKSKEETEYLYIARSNIQLVMKSRGKKLRNFRLFFSIGNSLQNKWGTYTHTQTGRTFPKKNVSLTLGGGLSIALTENKMGHTHTQTRRTFPKKNVSVTLGRRRRVGTFYMRSRKKKPPLNNLKTETTLRKRNKKLRLKEYDRFLFHVTMLNKY